MAPSSKVSRGEGAIQVSIIRLSEYIYKVTWYNDRSVIRTTEFSLSYLLNDLVKGLMEMDKTELKL